MASSLTVKKQLRKVGLEAPSCLVDAIQEGRNAGRRYKDKMYSNRLAYEIGAKILLEIDDDEEADVLSQNLENLRIERDLINSREKMMLDKLGRIEAKKKEREAGILKNQRDIEALASKLTEHWDKITLLNDKKPIDFIVNSFPDKLSKDRVKAVFPEKYTQCPSFDDLLQIAENLLNGGFRDEL